MFYSLDWTEAFGLENIKCTSIMIQNGQSFIQVCHSNEWALKIEEEKIQNPQFRRNNVRYTRMYFIYSLNILKKKIRLGNMEEKTSTCSVDINKYLSMPPAFLKQGVSITFMSDGSKFLVVATLTMHFIVSTLPALYCITFVYWLHSFQNKPHIDCV